MESNTDVTAQFLPDRFNEILPKITQLSNRLWIQDVLETHYRNHLGKQNTGSTSKSHPVQSFHSIPWSTRSVQSAGKSADYFRPKNIEVNVHNYSVSSVHSPSSNCITSITYTTDSCLSTLLSLTVNYTLLESDEIGVEKSGSFILKLPPEAEQDRDFVGMTNMLKREIQFYTEVITYLNAWTGSQNVSIVIAVPMCIWGKLNRGLQETAIPDIKLNFPQAESILVLEDLRSIGFMKRDFVEGLGVDELKSAMYELAKFHAVSWVIRKRNETNPIFKFAQKPLEMAVFYDVRLENGLKHLKQFLIRRVTKGKKLLKHVLIFEAKLRGTLVALLEPSSLIAPTTLVHMNCWMNKLMFRKKSPDFEPPMPRTPPPTRQKTDDIPEVPKAPTVSPIKPSTFECRILDWQLFAEGRPTHDVALLIMTSMSKGDRQLYTEHLLQYYYQVFEATVLLFGHALPFDLKCIQAEYKKSKLIALLFIIDSIHLVLAKTKTQERLVGILKELITENLL